MTRLWVDVQSFFAQEIPSDWDEEPLEGEDENSYEQRLLLQQYLTSFPTTPVANTTTLVKLWQR